MCNLRDGYGFDPLFAEFERRVRQNGFTMVNVEGSPPWTYSIGLSGGFDHPELVTVGLDPQWAADAITEAASAAMAGRRLSVGDELELGGDTFTVGAVHGNRWFDDTFAFWHRYYDSAPCSPPQAALQLLPPASAFCSCHASMVSRYRLDRPTRFSSADTDSRAERRRRARAEAKEASRPRFGAQAP